MAKKNGNDTKIKKREKGGERATLFRKSEFLSFAHFHLTAAETKSVVLGIFDGAQRRSNLKFTESE